MLERAAFAGFDADRIDLEDADVDLLPARLRRSECGLEELKLVAGRGRRDGGATGDVVLDLPAPQRRNGYVAQWFPASGAVLVVADAGRPKRAALAAHRLLALHQAVELVAELGGLLAVEVSELDAELQVELDRLGGLPRRHGDFREGPDAHLPATFAAPTDRHQRTSLWVTEARGSGT